ncbi:MULTISPECIES: LysR family transcriptional regulator [Pseudoalteromonas]|uniref:LysR family transcriptional regulator n=1 Tax=Pseudoalteromonas TaxID=53246 RepID=UPI000587D748|nr:MULTISPECIES: LysR family transcriptional regulator [Pseudoalteromonas]MAJ40705.1 LysR family transcriptional regulator [Pseudoalteromonadaceae bacterium]MCP4061455.1 LysR family transcriptional regulator [Pseudoalteromonas sp.]OUX86332.1 MAG: LysR family transcriptional regulator [Pseudoalteromonas sp. TMED43]MCK8096258.1 LysR family transcriptional regulator [Pseudoalteromonas sp. 1CM17D]TMS67906.1 LysR family transcriptional regulator [Pseudoalteromonas sp. S1691]
MINYLRHMAIFAKVVAGGSFRIAAKELGIAPSRVSHSVSDLEQFLGVTLLHRTTRKLSLTPEGEKFYAHVENITKHAEAGLNEINSVGDEPIGSLKISLPAFLASSEISAAIAEFVQTYPKVNLSLNYTDQVINIMDEGLDLSIRVGWLEDSSLMARKIGESKRFLVASSKYASKHQPPTHPNDLKQWDWVHFSMRGSTVDFTSPNGEVVCICEKSRVNVNSALAISHFVSENLGLGILPENLVKKQLAREEFIHILPNWQLKPLGYYAVWPNNARRENLTLLLVRFLAKRGLITAED